MKAFRGPFLFVIAISAVLLLQPGGRASTSQGGQHAAEATMAGRSATGIASLPLAAQAAISAAIGRDQSGYYAKPTLSGFEAKSSESMLAADFTRNGVRVRVGGASIGIAVEGFGRGDALVALSTVSPHAKANLVLYQRGALTEWYKNGPLGLEQGFRLSRPPVSTDRMAGKPLTIALALTGDLSASLESGGVSLTLRKSNGLPALCYTGLAAYDAAGRSLPAWFTLEGSRVLLRVRDARASYPIVVDPFLQVAKLTASDGAMYAWLGYSVAVSGNTVVVGAPLAKIGSNTFQGAAYVFVEPTNGWASETEAAKLTASDGAANDRLGNSVAINGNTVVVGAPGATINSNAGQGAAYVFVEPTSGWASETEAAKLTASDGAMGNSLGLSVAISNNAVVAGAYGSNSFLGAAYVFVEPSGGWASETETAKLTASEGVEGGGELGYSVGISGNTVVAGKPAAKIGDNLQQGAAYVFVEPPSGWTSETETAKLTASDGAAADGLGFSVAISGDTIVAGVPRLAQSGPNLQPGAAYLFIKPASGWASETEAAKLTASDGAAGDQFGTSVAISGDTIVVGAPLAQIGSNLQQGASYVFVKPGSGWASETEAAKLIASDGAAGDQFGTSVAISDDTVAAGAYAAKIGPNYRQGTAYVYSSLVPFSSFVPKLDITLGPPSSFDLNADFELGALSNGINPVNEPVSLQIGSLTLTLPAGSFAQNKKGNYVFEGTINGVNLQVQIKTPSTAGGAYQFTAEGSNTDLSGVTNPLAVVVKIGDDAGTAAVNAQIQ